MTHQPLPIARYAGIDLAASPDESPCIDQLNIDLDVRGAVRSRDGYDNFTGSELTGQPDSLFPFTTSAGTKRLLVGNGNRVDALNTSASSVDNETSTASPHFFTRFGGPTAEAVYFSNGTDQVKKFTSDAFATPGGLSGETGMFVAVTPTSNRLVIARESGSTAGNNPSSVRFSDAGDPENFTANNYVDLDPGDGEPIMGLASWGNSLFAFKESKIWEFYGESTDTVGETIFNVRKIDTGIGLISPRGVVAARDGVYFIARTGIYRTTGGFPQLVSGAIAPLFVGGVSDFYQGDEINQAAISSAALHFHNERIYVAVATGASTTNNRLLVFDPRYGEWLDWDIAASALASFEIGDASELVFGYPTGSNYIGRHSSAYTDDDGVAIDSRYRTGFTDYGAPGTEKDIDSTRLWGTGTIAVAGSRDFGALDTAEDVELGTAPAIAAGLHNKQKIGELVSYQFADSSGGAWILHRHAHYLRGTLPPGMRSF